MHHGLILTINTGSSSLKAALYRASTQLEQELQVSVERLGTSQPKIQVRFGTAQAESTNLTPSGTLSNQHEAVRAVFAVIDQHFDRQRLAIAGHRIVHGGPHFRRAALISAAMLTELRRITPFAPDHLPQALDAIDWIAEQLPKCPQLASFDTAFHADMPAVATTYALPGAITGQELIRYGFHGLSYTYVLQALERREPARCHGLVIIAHLGNGASMAAIRAGKSIDTSMGFAPESGLVMGSRPGDLDAGALLYLMEQRGMDAAAIRSLVNTDAGLLGVSGSSSDMQDLLQSYGHEDGATLAIDLFCYRARKYLGAYAAALGGLDVLVFTGGIGEHAPLIRERICEQLDFLGVALDAQANGKNAELISRPDARVPVYVLATDEDQVIAQNAWRYLDTSPPSALCR